MIRPMIRRLINLRRVLRRGMTECYAINIAFTSLDIKGHALLVTRRLSARRSSFTATYNHQGRTESACDILLREHGAKMDVRLDFLRYRQSFNSPGADISLYQGGGGTLYFTAFMIPTPRPTRRNWKRRRSLQ